MAESNMQETLTITHPLKIVVNEEHVKILAYVHLQELNTSKKGVMDVKVSIKDYDNAYDKQVFSNVTGVAYAHNQKGEIKKVLKVSFKRIELNGDILKYNTEDMSFAEQEYVS